MPEKPNVRIVTRAEELEEGLFGQVFLFVFEIIPYLHRHGIYPEWDIRAARYGAPPVRRIIPGVLDLAYVPAPAGKDFPLARLRDRHNSKLGADWPALHALWSAYFKVPARIVAEAEALGSFADVLGVHYRGNDKITLDWDSNFVSHADFAVLIRDFRRRRPHLNRLFVATDDETFVPYLQTHLPDVEIINLGDVGFHKAEDERVDLDRKADRALLDCLLLSRCGAVLKTSSALSGFAKVLRPDLEIYRVCASKLFADIPYFPVAYIPRYESDDPTVKPLVDRLMKDDWSEHASIGLAAAHAPRHRRRQLKWAVLEAIFGRFRELRRR